jgi:hypothetical protein
MKEMEIQIVTCCASSVSISICGFRIDLQLR